MMPSPPSAPGDRAGASPPAVLRRPVLRCVLLVALGVVAIIGTACGTRQPSREGAAAAGTGSVKPPTTESPAEPERRAAEPEPAGPRPPDLNQEPVIQVLLASTEQADLTLAAPGHLDDGRPVPAGRFTARLVGDGIRLNDALTVPGPVAIQIDAGGARFHTQALTPGGTPQAITCGGTPVIARDGDRLLVMERVPLEQYLEGVLPVEMSPRYPAEALKAQAIAAA